MKTTLGQKIDVRFKHVGTYTSIEMRPELMWLLVENGFSSCMQYGFFFYGFSRFDGEA